MDAQPEMGKHPLPRRGRIDTRGPAVRLTAELPSGDEESILLNEEGSKAMSQESGAL